MEKLIKITDFALRHFDKKFGGTKILNDSPDVIENLINGTDIMATFYQLKSIVNCTIHIRPDVVLRPGYASFCKLLFIKNITDAKVGTLPITLENYQYLRSGYSSRTPDELPVLSRWFEFPINPPIAKWLCFVLYSKEQIEKENNESFPAKWGVVAILGQEDNKEDPINPITMMRNAMGIEFGGSGVPIDKDKYENSVEFWSTHATIK